jgi:hypothetical protein
LSCGINFIELAMINDVEIGFVTDEEPEFLKWHVTATRIVGKPGVGVFTAREEPLGR